MTLTEILLRGGRTFLRARCARCLARTAMHYAAFCRAMVHRSYPFASQSFANTEHCTAHRWTLRSHRVSWLTRLCNAEHCEPRQLLSLPRRASLRNASRVFIWYLEYRLEVRQVNPTYSVLNIATSWPCLHQSEFLIVCPSFIIWTNRARGGSLGLVFVSAYHAHHSLRNYFKGLQDKEILLNCKTEGQKL